MSPAKSLWLALLCVVAYPLAEAAAQELPTGALLRLGTPQFRHDEEIMSLAYSPDGKRLASAGVSGKIRVWNVADAELLAQLPAGSGETVLFTPDSKGLICDGTTGGLALAMHPRDASSATLTNELGPHAGSITTSPITASHSRRTGLCWRNREPMRSFSGALRMESDYPGHATCPGRGSAR